jgi:hypothetical protein
MKVWIFGVFKRKFVDVWAFMSFLWKMIILMILVWNVVDSCYKLYFYVCYTYICLKLSSLCFWKLNFEFWRVFTSKPENIACLFMHACRGEWLRVVASKHVFPENMSTRLSELSLAVASLLTLNSPGEVIRTEPCYIVDLNEMHAYTMFRLWSYDYVIIYVTVIWALNDELSYDIMYVD